MVKRVHAFHPVDQPVSGSVPYAEEPEQRSSYQNYASSAYGNQNPSAFNASYTAAAQAPGPNSYYAPAESYNGQHYEQTNLVNAASPTAPLIYAASGAQPLQNQPFQSQAWQNQTWQNQTGPGSPSAAHRQLSTASWWSAFGTGGYADEPSLLEELGINFAHIKSKTMSSINPFRRLDAGSLADADMSGPLLFCFLFGASLLLTGKVHFGYIYGVATLGWLSVYALLNLMAEAGAGFYAVGSVLGYCLLPMVALSALAILLKLQYSSPPIYPLECMLLTSLGESWGWYWEPAVCSGAQRLRRQSLLPLSE
jgi:hypothetical protein